MLFLLLLSFALVYGATCEDPAEYNGRTDQFRAFCEIVSIILLMLQLLYEISEVIRFVQNQPSASSIFISSENSGA